MLHRCNSDCILPRCISDYMFALPRCMLDDRKPKLMSDFSLRYIYERCTLDYRFDRCIQFDIFALYDCKTAYTLSWCNWENIFENCIFDHNDLRYSPVYKCNYQRCNSAHRQCFVHYISAYTGRPYRCKHHLQTQNLNDDNGKKKSFTGMKIL